MWLVVFVFWHNRQPDDCIVPFIITVIIFPSRNWCDTTDKLSEIYFNRRSDNCTFFPVVIFSGGSKKIAGQTTVPFFSGRNLLYLFFVLAIIFWSRICQTDDCIFFTPARQTTRTFFSGSNNDRAPVRQTTRTFFSSPNNDRAPARQTTALFFFRL